jgi:hypothetical protein
VAQSTERDPHTLVASAENLHQVVSMLRPDLVLLPRRDIEEAIMILIEARERQGHPKG